MIGEEYPLIPDEAFLYFPTEQDIKPNVRRIFGGGLPYDSEEIRKLREFDQFLLKNRIKLGPQHDDQFKLRFLQSAGFHNDKAMKAVISHLKWQKETTNQLTPKITSILNQGVCYMSGRDAYYRPILVIDVKKMVKIGASTQDLLATQAFFFTYIIRKCFIQGQIENWVTVIDLGQVGLFSASGPFKKSISFLSDNFKCRMGSASVVNCSGSVSMLWGVAKGFVEEETQKKISFEHGNVPIKLMPFLNPSQLQRKYGGTLPNIAEFWPPIINSLNFKTSIQVHLVDPEEYRLMYEKGMLKSREINRKFIQESSKTQPIIDNVQEQAQTLIVPEKLVTINQIHQTSKAYSFNNFANVVQPPTPYQIINNSRTSTPIQQLQQMHNLTEPSINQLKTRDDSESSQEYLTFYDDPPPDKQTQISTEDFPLAKTATLQRSAVKTRIDYIAWDSPRSFFSFPSKSHSISSQQIRIHMEPPQVKFVPCPTPPPVFLEFSNHQQDELMTMNVSGKNVKGRASSSQRLDATAISVGGTCMNKV